MEDKQIIQKNFLKGKIEFNFKENGFDYSLKESDEKMKFFIGYSDIYDMNSYSEVKKSVLYYLLIGILFFIMGILFRDLFYLLFGIVFFVLYYKSRENYLQFSAYTHNFFIYNNKEKNKILEEIKDRQKYLRKQREFILEEENGKEYEREKFENLLKDEIITKKEYEKIMEKVEKIKENYDEYKPN